MRQGNDVGTQYRSAIYWFDEKQRLHAESSRDRYQSQLTAAGLGTITTEIAQAATFFYAEEYHQQYHTKNLAKSGMAPSDLAAWYVSESPVKPLPVACHVPSVSASMPIQQRAEPQELRTSAGSSAPVRPASSSAARARSHGPGRAGHV